MSIYVFCILDSDVKITYRVEVKVTGGKKNPYQGRVTKVVRELPVHLTRNEEAYQNARREAGQEDFSVGQGERQGWGTRGEDGLIYNNGMVYVQYIGKEKWRNMFLKDFAEYERRLALLEHNYAKLKIMSKAHKVLKKPVRKVERDLSGPKKGAWVCW